MLSQGVDQNSDGQLEFLLTQTFVGDSMVIHDVGNDGSIEYRTRSDFDAFGNPIYQDRDGVFNFGTAELISPANGVPDVTYTWDSYSPVNGRTALITWKYGDCASFE
jgi:hypothetical protein